MAEFMSDLRKWLVLGAMLIASSAMGEVLPDPTRPPDALNPVFGNAVTVNAGPVLQSVLISRGRRVAIISGKQVRVNDKFGDARVMKITETEVVLQSGKDRQTLKLFPEMDKKAAHPAKDRKIVKRGKKVQGTE